MKERPGAAVIPPGGRPGDEETTLEMREFNERNAELDRRRTEKMNKVAAMLGGTHYIVEKTWPFLFWQDRQISVSEFYPERNIAIDKFYHVGDWEEAITEFKRKVLKENGIKYAFLTPDKTLADIEADLEG